MAGLKLSGIVGQLAAQTELVRCDGRELVLRLPEAQRHLTDKAYADKLRAALDDATGVKLRLAFELASGAEASLAAQARRERAEQKAKTEAQFRDEPFVREVAVALRRNHQAGLDQARVLNPAAADRPAHGPAHRRGVARSIHR